MGVPARPSGLAVAVSESNSVHSRPFESPANGSRLGSKPERRQRYGGRDKLGHRIEGLVDEFDHPSIGNTGLLRDDPADCRLVERLPAPRPAPLTQVFSSERAYSWWRASPAAD